MDTRWAVLILLVALSASSGCQANPVDPEPTMEITSTPEIPREIIETPDRIDNVAKTPERVPPTEAFPHSDGEIPAELLDSIFKDLEDRSGVNRTGFNLLQAQAVIWNDGSLGCPRPGVMYTQALVNGYWIVIEAEGREFDYRAADSGFFTLCENGLPPAHATPNS